MKITFISTFKLFSNYLYTKQKAINTILAYENDMKLFYTFLHEKLNNKIRYINDFTRVETFQYQEYLIQLVDDGVISLNTAFRKYNTLKTFFRFAHEKYGIPNILKGDTWGNSKKLHKDDFYLILDQEHIQHLLKTLQDSTTKNKYRDLVIFIMLITTGCRREDVLNLQFADIDYTRNELLLYHNKTSSGKVVQLPPLLKQALINYEKANPCTDPTAFVVRSRHANSLSESRYSDIIKEWVKKSGIQNLYKKDITGHAFRHTFVTNCIRNNISDQKIMDYTGHLDSKSLENYKHLVSNDHNDIANMYDIAL